MSVYCFNQPVHDHPTFVGRDVLLKSLTDAIARGRVFVLVGCAKTGRTSVLKKLTDRADEALRQPSSTAKQVLVYVDLEALNTPNPNQLVQLLWTALQNKVLDPYVQNHPDPPRPITLKILRTDDPWQVFKDAADALWSKLANTPGWCRYTLLLDNADALAHPGWGACIDQLAGLVSRSEGARPQALGLVGSLGIRSLLGPHKRSMRAARLHVLEPLRGNDVQALSHLAALPADALEAVYQAVGGHPWLVQRACAAIEAEPEGAPAAVCETLGQELVPTFEATLAALPPPARGTGVSLERALLAWLLAEGCEGDAAQAEATLGLGPVRAACDNLVATGFLERSVRGMSGTWLRLASSQFNAWAAEALHV